MKTIVIGGGCFWCVEAVFNQVNGIESVVSGYAGGDEPDPTYSAHGSHAEVVQVTYDESKIPLGKIFEMFFYTHDPTTLNRQGNDHGTQYRSIILTATDEETELAKESAKESAALWDGEITTEIKLLGKFYSAEAHHQNYYDQNKNAPYCQVIINPKVAKFRTKFAGYLKTN